jgi:phosphoglycolate phosphatase-like HAD superfamily hydrolase
MRSPSPSPSPRLLAFDVDGTIADTRDLSAKAYAEVGVAVPDGAWGVRWQVWLTDLLGGDLERATDTHARKTAIYASVLRQADLRPLVLPAGRLAYTHLAGGRRPVRYLTAGSSHTATILLARLGILGPLESNLTYRERWRELRRMPGGTPYVDDNEQTIRTLATDCPHLNLIHYSGQSYEQLTEEVLWKRWTR